MNTPLYHLIGIGIGPYNLGLAALTEENTDLHTIFFEQNGEFAWHPGMLINGSDLQVSFLADLVTFANPTSRYSYLNYLHSQNRLYPFFFYHKLEIPREEYAAYLEWVANQLKNCVFKSEVVDVIDHESFYEVIVYHWNKQEYTSYYAKNIVLGTGSTPLIPIDLEQMDIDSVYHSSQYLYHKKHTLQANHITVVGSGQSASEIFYDLLKLQDTFDYHLAWYTRSPGFLQLDSSKLGQEVFTPDYVNYFHKLSFDVRITSLEYLGQLRKGIDGATLQAIFELLYQRSIRNKSIPVTIQPLTEIDEVNYHDNNLQVHAKQWQQNNTISFDTDKLILATGYKPNIPQWFLDRYSDKIKWEDEKRFKVDKTFKIEFQNNNRPHHFYTLTNLEHSHGTAATNLSLAVYRNILIINEIAGKQIYKVPQRNSFTNFG